MLILFATHLLKTINEIKRDKTRGGHDGLYVIKLKYGIYVIFNNKRGIYDQKNEYILNEYILAHTKTRICDKLRRCEK